MKLTISCLKQLIKEELVILKEGDWDVSKRTALPRVISQILSALRETQDIVEGGHLDEKEPVSPLLLEEIKKIFEHPGLETLKKLGGVSDENAMEGTAEEDLPYLTDEEESEY